jgi:hypothetical protein
VVSKEGIVNVKEIAYSVTDTFKGGNYEILVRDVTRGVQNKMSDLKIELVIVDPEEILAA